MTYKVGTSNMGRSARIVDETRLTELNIPHLDVVLDEIFHVPSPQVFPGVPPLPETVGELVQRTGLSRGKVASLLEEVRVRAADIEIRPDELKALLDQKVLLILLDVREEWEFEICRIPESRLLHAEEFEQLLPELKAASHVITICHHGVRSFSAAMYLREIGVTQARSLAGGVERWAREIDPTMARY